VEGNDMMMEVSKNELKIVLATFENNKSLCPYGWTIELFIGFYDMFEEEFPIFIQKA